MEGNGRDVTPEELRELLTGGNPTVDDLYEALRASFHAALPSGELLASKANAFARNEASDLPGNPTPEDIALHATAVTNAVLMSDSMLKVLATYLHPVFERVFGEPPKR